MMDDNLGKISDAEERFEHLRRTIGLWLGPVVFLIVLLLPLNTLTPPAHHLAAVLGWVLIYWMCEPIPIPVTALFGPALCVVLGIAEAKTLLASFGDPVIFVFLGSFLLAEAMMVHHVDRRMALMILSLRWVGNSIPRVIFVFGLIAATISLGLSNTTTTAMLLPIALGILSEIGHLLHKQGRTITQLAQLRISRGLLLITAYGASVGGIGTPIGTPPNLIGIGLIHKLLDVQISFVDWMRTALPILLVMFLGLYFLIIRIHPPEVSHLPGMADYFRRRNRELGPWSRGQWNALLAFGVAVVLWLIPGAIAIFDGGDSKLLTAYQAHVPEGIAALLAACLLFVLPINFKERRFTLTWQEATHIDWGTILLFGGGIALGSLAFSTGLAKALGDLVITTTGITSLSGITFLSIFMGILISEMTSNTASANMVIPVAIAVAQSCGVDPLLPAMGACLGSSYGFMLPVSTPPNAIVYGSGMVPIRAMVKTGFIFDLIGLFVIWGGLLLLGITHTP
jgi:sodium-dependent dicarboxylate transporter 2/3/5